MTALLSVRDLAVSFGARRAVDGVSFDIEPGACLALVGESGSGKSVTAMSLLGLLPRAAHLDSGSILWHRDGPPFDLARATPRELRRVRGAGIATIFQEPMTSLNPVLTIGDQITEAVRLHRGLRGKRARAAAAEALNAVGIPDPAARLRSYPHEFSGGMRQRAMIAIALACEPRLLIADEPTTALDVTVQAQILDLIDRLRAERGMAVLLITHDLGVAAQRAGRVGVMYAGRIVETGPMRDVLRSPAHPYTAGLLGSIPRLTARAEHLPTVRVRPEDTALPGSSARCWWPTHAPPQERPTDAPAGTIMHPLGPDRAVLVWDTPGKEPSPCAC